MTGGWRRRGQRGGICLFRRSRRCRVLLREVEGCILILSLRLRGGGCRGRFGGCLGGSLGRVGWGLGLDVAG